MASNIRQARDVIACHVTQETRVHSALDDAASNIRQALGVAAGVGAGAGGSGGGGGGGGGGRAVDMMGAVAASGFKLPPTPPGRFRQGLTTPVDVDMMGAVAAQGYKLPPTPAGRYRQGLTVCS